VTEIDPKLSRLYREASTDQPPAALDSAILAAARTQAGLARRPARASWVRWMAPTSALATLVVAVSLAFLVGRERPATVDGAVIRQTRPKPQIPPPASVTESAKNKAAGGAAPAAPTKQAAPAAAESAASAAAIEKETPAAAPTPAPATVLPEPGIAAPARSAADAFPAERRAKAAASGAASESNAAGDSALDAAQAAAPAAAAGKLAPLRQQSIHRSAQAWLEEISRLKREGRGAEAAAQLAEFRRVYPAHALPESLRDLR
jgi:hypothetical protein